MDLSKIALVSVVVVSSMPVSIVFASANAATTIYNSKSSFLAATTGITTVDFEGLIPPNTANLIDPPNNTISGVSFSGSVGNPFILNCASLPSGFGGCDKTIPLVGPTTVGGTGLGENIITATLPSGITAVGVDLLPYNFGQNRTVTISTGDSQTLVIDNAVYFIGFTSTTPITFLNMFSSNGGQVFDNVVYGQAITSAVPEPLNILGATTGLVLFGTISTALKRKKVSK